MTREPKVTSASRVQIALQALISPALGAHRLRFVLLADPESTVQPSAPHLLALA